MFYKISLLILIILFSGLTIFCVIKEHYWTAFFFSLLTGGAFSSFTDTPMIKIGNSKE